jgi:transposase
LPPYWPDLKPIGRIWLAIKARWFNIHVCNKMKKILERLNQPIVEAIDSPKLTQQTTAIGTLF